MKKLGILLLLGASLVLFASCTSETTETTTTTTGPTTSTWSYTVGDSTNTENIALGYADDTVDSVQVLPVENLTDEFIFGVDISSIVEVYDNGGKFYDSDGVETDLFQLLSDAGVNYVRIRLWVDPYDADGNPYGGGTNDLQTAIKIASKAKAFGMGVCLDFHYSDFWADPGQQEMPKAWAELTSLTALIDEIYQYTFDVLTAMDEEGVLPDMVELGNEINNGMMWEYGHLTGLPARWTNLASFLNSAAQAVDDVSPDIKKILHLANGGTYSIYEQFFDKMETLGVDYDIIGLSYYSYWHGTIAELQDNMDRISERYDKPVMVMEMAYGFTTLGNSNASNIYNASMEESGGYKTSVQGQASYLRDVINAVCEVPDGKGLGAFYWEPAWIPVAGAGWAKVASGRTVVGQELASWANQALFTYSGKALPTLKILDLIANASEEIDVTILPGTVETQMETTLNLSLNEQLPETTTAVDSLYRYTTVNILWNQAEVDAMTGVGTYVVHGTLEIDDSVTITCTVTAVENYLVNPGLEDRGSTGQMVIPPWYGAGGVKTNQTDPHTGQGHVNIWASSDFTYNFYQDVVLPAGTYQLSFWVMGASADQPTIHLYAANVSTSQDIEVSGNLQVTSWPNYIYYEITFTITEGTTVRVGVRGEGVGGNWAHCDDWILQQIDE